MSADPTTVELYKLGVEMADRISARRALANSFFLATQSALVAAAGLSTDRWALNVAGIAVACAWWLQLRSYRDLNRAKFSVLQAIESDLPVRLFSDEWERLKGDPVKGWRGRYAELGFAERAIPCIFVGVHLALVLT